MLRIGAIIPAAGIERSEFRPMSVVSSNTLIRHNVDILQQVGIKTIIVVTGDRHTALEHHLSDRDVRFVYNEKFADSEMLGSILLGLDALEGLCDRVLILPADVPMVRQQTILDMLALDAPFICPVYHGAGGHPVLLDCRCTPLLRQYTGTGGLRDAIQCSEIKTLELETDDVGVLLENDSSANLDHIHMLESHQLNDGHPFHLNVQLSLADHSDFFWDESAMLLQLIDDTGSIQTACGCLHISYSKGWKMIERIESQLGYCLLERVVGGSKGGGSRLTPEGIAFLEKFQAAQKGIREAAQNIFRQCFLTE